MEESAKAKTNYVLPASIILAAVIFSVAWVYDIGRKTPANQSAKLSQSEQTDLDIVLEEKVLPKNGVELPVKWGDLGIKMTESGVIDTAQFEALYADRGGLDDNSKKLLYGRDNGAIVINRDNSGVILNLFWALGLGNKNSILEEGPMMDSEYGGAGNFASTGGWTLARGGAMNHYSMHQFMKLTPEQQAAVERVSNGIYRPCCGNSTYFPDCNHGMAMLGLLELMASQGVSENDMYKVALAVNSYWFSDTYLTIAKYMQSQGVDWSKVDPKQVLGEGFSSSRGYQDILSKTKPVKRTSGGGCGV